MNKSKIILASVGGVALTASLVLAYLIWSAMADKSERAADLDGAIATADRLTRLPVYPGTEGIKAYNENAETYKAWREEAVKIASAGDMAFESTTPPAFKAFLVDDARRLSALPGAVDGRLVKEDFPFGFKDYITGGVLPAQADLARLQREWYDVSTVIEALAKCGVSEIVDVAIKPPAPVQPEQTAKSSKKNKGMLWWTREAQCRGARGRRGRVRCGGHPGGDPGGQGLGGNRTRPSTLFQNS